VRKNAACMMSCGVLLVTTPEGSPRHARSKFSIAEVFIGRH
jgi:hypothetical protein